jgi:hypothetical protein
MPAPECSIFGCGKKAEIRLLCPTADQLHEAWYACYDHVPRVLRFITNREEAWAMPWHTHGADFLSQA